MVVPFFFLLKFLKEKTGGSRLALLHTFVRQQKYAKGPSRYGLYT